MPNPVPAIIQSSRIIHLPRNCTNSEVFTSAEARTSSPYLVHLMENRQASYPVQQHLCRPQSHSSYRGRERQHEEQAKVAAAEAQAAGKQAVEMVLIVRNIVVVFGLLRPLAPVVKRCCAPNAGFRREIH